MDWAALIHLLAFVVMLAGLVGVVLPFLPGIPLIWFGVFLSAIGTNFTKIDVWFVAVVGILTLVTYGLDYWSAQWQLKEYKVTAFGVVGGVLGGFFGLFFGIVPALTIGPLLGAVIGEMVTGRDSMFVLQTSTFKIIGYIGSTLVKGIVGIIIIGCWFAYLLR